jgi:hypothetical protein
MTLESTDGFVRVVARRDFHRIVGWQAEGTGARIAYLSGGGIPEGLLGGEWFK